MDFEKGSVKKAVLETLIAYYPQVKNYAVERAHPKHKMSGLQRLRELRARGIVDYSFDRKTNTYHIHTPLKALRMRFLTMARERTK